MSQSNDTDPCDRDSEPGGTKLEDLGLGPESVLMHEPKLFQERQFLGLVLAELDKKFDPEPGRRALFQIGACHGMRDARCIWQAPPACDTDQNRRPQGRTPTLPMRLLSQHRSEGGFEIHGIWPDRHEANSRLTQLGKSPDPTCFLSAGYTSGWLSETRGHDIVVMEESCWAAGDDHCLFRAVDTGSGLRADNSVVAAGLEPLGNETNSPTSPTADRAGTQSAIHIWGPVLVLPCPRVADAKATLANLPQNEDLQDVRVVVIDLLHHMIQLNPDDPSFCDLLDAIEQRGAEAILTGLNPAMQSSMESLDRPLLVAPGPLPEAIAMAFRVAEAGRYLL